MRKQKNSMPNYQMNCFIVILLSPEQQFLPLRFFFMSGKLYIVPYIGEIITAHIKIVLTGGKGQTENTTNWPKTYLKECTRGFTCGSLKDPHLDAILRGMASNKTINDCNVLYDEWCTKNQVSNEKRRFEAGVNEVVGVMLRNFRSLRFSSHDLISVIFKETNIENETTYESAVQRTNTNSSSILTRKTLIRTYFDIERKTLRACLLVSKEQFDNLIDPTQVLSKHKGYASVYAIQEHLVSKLSIILFYLIGKLFINFFKS